MPDASGPQNLAQCRRRAHDLKLKDSTRARRGPRDQGQRNFRAIFHTLDAARRCALRVQCQWQRHAGTIARLMGAPPRSPSIPQTQPAIRSTSERHKPESGSLPMARTPPRMMLAGRRGPTIGGRGSDGALANQPGDHSAVNSVILAATGELRTPTTLENSDLGLPMTSSENRSMVAGEGSPERCGGA